MLGYTHTHTHTHLKQHTHYLWREHSYAISISDLSADAEFVKLLTQGTANKPSSASNFVISIDLFAEGI